MYTCFLLFSFHSFFLFFAFLPYLRYIHQVLLCVPLFMSLRLILPSRILLLCLLSSFYTPKIHFISFFPCDCFLFIFLCACFILYFIIFRFYVLFLLTSAMARCFHVFFFLVPSHKGLFCTCFLLFFH